MSACNVLFLLVFVAGCGGIDELWLPSPSLGGGVDELWLPSLGGGVDVLLTELSLG